MIRRVTGFFITLLQNINMTRFVILFLCCLPLGLAAQYVPTNETGPRYIQVTGSAEMTVPAD